MTPKQERFVQEYLIDLNATQAAVRAGYSAKTAYTIGQKLTKNNEAIRAAIAAAIKARKEKSGVTAEQVIKELARIAFANPRQIFEWGPHGVSLLPSEGLTEDEAAAVAEVAETRTESGGSIKAKLHDKTKALELLGRHLGMFSDRVELSGGLKIGSLADLAMEIADERSE